MIEIKKLKNAYVDVESEYYFMIYNKKVPNLKKYICVK